MDILTLNSKAKLSCNICDKCCIYRGDIKITSINVAMISKYLKISTSEFLRSYTHEVEGEFPEIALNGIGKARACILYDENTYKCTIHKVKPMQCVMFPLVPEDLKNDLFINSGECEIETNKKIKVKKWLGGNRGIYMKYKEFYIKWIVLMEEIQFRKSHLTPISKSYIRKYLYEEFNLKKNLKKQAEKNLQTVTHYVMKNFKDV